MFLVRLLLSFGLIVRVWSAFELGWKDDTDLTNFVTRPEIRAPRLDVDIYDAAALEQGYFFVAPYTSLVQPIFPADYYQACQTGPHIYRYDGELVWSGACDFKNQNAFDFRASEENGTYILSAILNAFNKEDRKGHGIIMDSSYHVTNRIQALSTLPNFNMHEFKILPGGKKILCLLYKPGLADTRSLKVGMTDGWVGNGGFAEIDIESGEPSFTWWAGDHVALSESSAKIQDLAGPYPKAWDWFHANSVDKNDDGDYILSARFTDCIYKISGKTGEISWRLGGTNSSFKLKGFNFSRQHDAHWLEHDEHREVISFLDNGADDKNATAHVSSALVVELDKRSEPMTARVLYRWPRPDGKLSRLRGNFQTLPNGNAFVGWSDNAYMSEHTPDGRVLMEARFRSTRFVTYRSYKLDFIGMPTEPPILRAFTHGTSLPTQVTVFYVSWNGATEVDRWDFFRMEAELIGSTRSTGFETVFESQGREDAVYAVARAANGSFLGRSATYNISPPFLTHRSGAGIRDCGSTAMQEDSRSPEQEEVERLTSQASAEKTEL